jgi:hypothetical protein
LTVRVEGWMNRKPWIAAWIVLSVAGTAAAQDASAVWNAVSQPAFDPAKSAAVEGVEIVRDRIHITLISGSIQFGQPANGLVFAAAFQGRGRVKIDPPTAQETQQLRRFAGKDKLDMEFSDATFSFSDDTFAELSSQLRWRPTPDQALASLYQTRQRDREDVGAEVVPRLVQGVLSADHKRTALFFCDLKTSDKGWVEVAFDAMEPEQVLVGRRDAWPGFTGFDTWLHFPANGVTSSDAFKDPLALADYAVQSYQIDATVTNGAELTATTTVHLADRVTGERVIRFALDSNLRVDSVKNESGAALSYFQAREQKERNDSYGTHLVVALAQPTESGKLETLTFHYGGKRVVTRVGPGNYFCQSGQWYPDVPPSSIADRPEESDDFNKRTNFEMTFRVPRIYSLVATGVKTGEETSGNTIVTTWKSPKPLAVAGFAFGDYTIVNNKAGDVNVEVYANRKPDDSLTALSSYLTHSDPNDPDPIRAMPNRRDSLEPSDNAAVGNMSPAGMSKQMAGEVGNAMRLFESYYGPAPFDRIAVANIPGRYGQGWPMLLYLSTLSFLDSTQRNALKNFAPRLDQVQLTDFFRAHEVSHQWWGHKVGWKSYHDQWLSEGFAQFSGNLYTEYRENWKQYQERLTRDRQDLFAHDRSNKTPESAGPIWMGARLASADTPGAYSTVIYDKGGLVLNMLRMMLRDPQNPDPDHNFKAMMQDFCQTFDNKAASTEDFKAIAEKHMLPAMDLDGNNRLDWFFNQYVYGTGIAEYTFTSNVQDAGGGKWKVSGTVTRSGVADTWKDILPIYITAGGRTVRLGWIRAIEKETPFNATLPVKPDKLTLNDDQDILTDIKQ